MSEQGRCGASRHLNPACAHDQDGPGEFADTEGLIGQKRCRCQAYDDLEHQKNRNSTRIKPAGANDGEPYHWQHPDQGERQKPWHGIEENTGTEPGAGPTTND